MKKAKLTRSLLAACSIVALSAVMYGCVHSGDDDTPAMEMPVDTDGDGVADADDAFPNDASETKDSDGDGVGDNAQEKAALAAAKSAAMAAWETARDALASIAGEEDENPVAYQRAMNALEDAKKAYDAAATATTSADAEMYQADAEAARDTATTQVAMVVYSRDMEAIGVARGAAEQAAQAAKRAYDAAKKALADVEAFKALDMASYDMAVAQVRAAEMAYNAAMAASEAAAEAMLLDDAVAQRDAAQIAKDNADAANTDAMKYAGMVQTAENNALADARKKADEAYKAAKMTAGEARQAATDADAEADAAEAANEGSPAAIASRTAANEADEAATDAETAAGLAGDAKMAADDAATSAAARDHQADAEEEKGNAEGHLETAQMKLADAETAKITAQNTGAGTILLWQQRAMDANDDAQGYAKAARDAADKADEQADAADADAAKAMRARTDYDTAKKKATAARNAANAAETAAAAAEKAAADAKAAYDLAMADDATVAVAREQSTVARTAAMGAAGHPATANAEYMKAMTAAGEAKMYAGRHVISLLAHANGQDITDVTEDVTTAPALMKARETRLKAARGVIGEAGAGANNINGAVDATNPTTVVATWGADTADDEDTDADETMIRMLDINLQPDGSTRLAFKTTEAAAENDPTTVIDDTLAKTASALDRGLGSFTGYQIEDDGTHAIVFTDKMQNIPSRAEVTAITARELVDDPLTGNTVTDLGTRSGTGYTGVTLYELGSVDDDTDPDLAFMGRLTCPSPDAGCSAEIAADGSITVTGFVFTGSREARDAVAALTEAANPANSDYLAFGVWLIEDGDTTTDGVQCCDFAAFAGGGRSVPSFNAYAALTGPAKYTGKAAGVYTAGSSVDYFEGNAILIADLDKIDEGETTDDENGTISGTISGIVAGGVNTGDTINLMKSDAIADESAAFSGNATMGPGVDEDNDGTLEYTYSGSWSGNFFGPNLDDTSTTDVNELAAPDAVAGTFGVTGTMGEGEDAVTRSYVGAFGARKDD